MVEGPHAIWKAPAIGRIYSISSRQGDCNYVRLLLTEVCGPSFTAQRTMDGQELSFREPCLARGFLENDQHLHLAMEEAGISQSAPNLRSLMAVILTTCFPTNGSRFAVGGSVGSNPIWRGAGALLTGWERGCEW